MSILPSRLRSVSLQVMTSVFWPPMSTVLKNFQTSGFLSSLVSAVTTCLSLSLHLSRSTSGDAAEFDAFETISACCGVAPHPSAPSGMTAETRRSTRVLDMSMAATVGRNARFIKSEPAERLDKSLRYLLAWLDHRPMVMHGHVMARKKISTTIYI